MKNLISAFLFLFCISTSNYAQEVALQCSETEAITFDNLDGFTFTMTTENSPGSQPNPLCPTGGAPHNISWFAFVAESGVYDIRISSSNCMGSTTGMEGLQYGVYTDCSFSEAVYCDPACNLDTVFLSSNLFIAGETYYMFIDGCSGSYCDIIVEVIYDDGGPVSVVDFPEKGAESVIHTYPNPVKNQLNLESNVGMNEVMVYDAEGKLVIQQKLKENSSSWTIDVEGWNKGLYFIQIRLEEGISYKKILVE